MTTSQLERDFKSQSLHIRFEKLQFETLLAYLSTMGLVLMETGAKVTIQEVILLCVSG